jgi:enoyl-CoA hydratase/carnithine racemase
VILVERQDGIIRITLNRPQDRNSIDSAVIEAIEAALQRAERNEDRAVVFCGTGGTFFAGGADATEMIRYAPEEAKAFSAKIQGLYDRIEASPLVAIAAINGLCYGGGLELAMACDLRVAGESARMGLPEVRVGIIPGGGGTQRLPAIVGTGRAMEMILSGRLYDAREALAFGLVNWIAADDSVLEATLGHARSALRNPPHALAAAKRAVYGARPSRDDEGYAREREEFGRCFAAPFFRKEIARQLDEGIMTTTRELPSWVRAAGRPTEEPR